MALNKKTIEDIEVSGKKVLVRCDFNVPLDENKNITDETRINAALPTIKYLLDHGAAVILCSHLGRPKGEFNMKYSLAPVAKRLSEKLGFEVKLAKDVVGPDAKKLAAEVKPGEAVLLENVRFHARGREERSRPLPRSWLPWRKSTSPTPSAPCTAPMLPPPAWPPTCPPLPVSSSARS